MSDNEYTPAAWRMTGYYPESYAKFMSALGIGLDYDDEDYERYESQFLADLAAHDAEVKADAWDEGAEAQFLNSHHAKTLTPIEDELNYSEEKRVNPYRTPKETP